MNSQDDLIVVAGPTASGKTNYAVNLAKKINGLIINADSMQVYRGMDIGTNKGEVKKLGDLGIKILSIAKLMTENEENEVEKDHSKKVHEINAYEIENSGVVGYMFDIIEPDEDFSVADYQILTKELLFRVREDGKIPILVGGTGLYIDSILKNYSLAKVEKDNVLRGDLSRFSVEQLYDHLYQISPEVALELNESDRFNKRRLIRKIEIAREGNVNKETNKMVPHIMYYPKFEREVLYERINNRVEEMFNEGLIDEVESLIKMGYRDCKSMQGMGYKEVVEYLEGEITLDEAKTKMKQAHRNYASRQITWFENDRRGYNLVKVEFGE